MTIYELISEDEQTELYNTLLSPVEEERQISFSCHIRRGGIDSKNAQIYELVQFVGYFSKSFIYFKNNIYRIRSYIFFLNLNGH